MHYTPYDNSVRELETLAERSKNPIQRASPVYRPPTRSLRGRAVDCLNSIASAVFGPILVAGLMIGVALRLIDMGPDFDHGGFNEYPNDAQAEDDWPACCPPRDID